MIDPKDVEFFAVRNKEGKWFRRKGYNGYGETWTDNFKQARIYTKIGGARSIVSFFANKWKEYGTPDIIKFNVNEFVVISEEDRIKKQKEKKEEERRKSELREKERNLSKAKAELEAAKIKYEKLK